MITLCADRRHIMAVRCIRKYISYNLFSFFSHFFCMLFAHFKPSYQAITHCIHNYMVSYMSLLCILLFSVKCMRAALKNGNNTKFFAVVIALHSFHFMFFRRPRIRRYIACLASIKYLTISVAQPNPHACSMSFFSLLLFLFIYGQRLRAHISTLRFLVLSSLVVYYFV